jgi:hypothetical protein
MTLRGPTTGEGQPRVVKCGVCLNVDDADADERLEEEEWGDDDDEAEVLIVATRQRVRSAWE